MKRDTPPKVHEWQVLPFATTCSPCCAIYVLQSHAHSLAAEHSDLQTSVLSAFYVDNCLQSLPSVLEAKAMVNKLSHDCSDPCEGTLGLTWHCLHDTLSFKHCPVEYTVPTMQILYRILARQYDPLGFIIPFTTRAKVMIQQLWMKPDRG